VHSQDDPCGTRVESGTKGLFYNATENQTEGSMKRIAIAFALVVLLFAIVAQAQTPEPKAGPEQKKLGIWTGDWVAEGENKATPLGPAGKYSLKSSIRKILGGFFVEFRVESNGPSGASQYYEIDGYDAVNKKFTWNGFDSSGMVSVVTYTLEGNTCAYSGTITWGDKQYKLRGTFVFAADLNSYVLKDELSVDGKTWMPKSEEKGTKAKKSSPK
jgi:hypothetical protein